MSDNPFKKLADEFDQHERKKKPARVNRTLRLENEGFLLLQEYCQERGITVSEVVDRLINEFLGHAGLRDSTESAS